MVQSLRTELQKSMEQAKGESLQFSLGQIELELNVEVSRELGGKGKIQFWVFSVGASASKTSGSTHTFRLTLLPVSRDGRTPLISGETTEKPRDSREEAERHQ
jgi:hypothetical protein